MSATPERGRKRRLRDLRIVLSQDLERIADRRFPPGTKLTLIVRLPEDREAAILIGNDTIDGVLDAITHLAATGEDHG